MAIRGQISTLAQVGSATTLATSWGTNPQAGSKILVFVQCGSVPTSVVDNGVSPTTFALDKSTTAGKGAHVYRADNITLPAAGTAYKATVTVGVATTIQVIGIEYQNAASGGPVATNNGGATSVDVASGAVTGLAGAIYFGGFSDASALNPETITFNSSPPFTEQARNTNGSSFWPFAMADAVIAAGGSQSLSWTLGDSVAWGAVITVYADASVVVARKPRPWELLRPGRVYRGLAALLVRKQQFATRDRPPLVAAASAGVDLAATPTGVGNLTGALSTAHTLAASATGVGAATAALSVKHSLAAGPTGVGNVTAALSVKHDLASAPTGVGRTTGALAVTHSLAVGNVGVGRSTGALSVTHLLTAGPTGVGRVTAALTVTSSGAQLAATATGVGQVSGALAISVSLQVVGIGVGRAAGTLTPDLVTEEVAGGQVPFDYRRIPIKRSQPPRLERPVLVEPEAEVPSSVRNDDEEVLIALYGAGVLLND